MFLNMRDKNGVEILDGDWLRWEENGVKKSGTAHTENVFYVLTVDGEEFVSPSIVKADVSDDPQVCYDSKGNDITAGDTVLVNAPYSSCDKWKNSFVGVVEKAELVSDIPDGRKVYPFVEVRDSKGVVWRIDGEKVTVTPTEGRGE